MARLYAIPIGDVLRCVLNAHTSSARTSSLARMKIKDASLHHDPIQQLRGFEAMYSGGALPHLAQRLDEERRSGNPNPKAIDTLLGHAAQAREQIQRSVSDAMARRGAFFRQHKAVLEAAADRNQRLSGMLSELHQALVGLESSGVSSVDMPCYPADVDCETLVMKVSKKTL